MSKIIGQIGEKSNANKLLKWLKNWNTWHLEGSDKKKPWNDQENGSSFKCALLSGPPGIGKTTTATLTCKGKLNIKIIFLVNIQTTKH